MNTLVIDTSTDRTSCAVFADEALIYSGFQDGATEHAEVLPKLVAAALEVNKRVDRVIVGMGPGPFTGLRVGIVFAQTFASAREIPCIGVCSLDGIEVAADEYLVATDARRKEVFWARYKENRRVSGPGVGGPKDISNSEKAFGFGFTEPLFPNPRKLMQAANQEIFTEPIYLRRPDAQPTALRKIEIREMALVDVPALVGIDREIFPESPWSAAQFKEELAGVPRTHRYLVATESGRIVGYSGVAIVGEVADIHTLAVIPSHRNAGLASQMLDQLEKWAIEKGVAALMLEMREGNNQAQQLYEKRGYRAISKRKDYYRPGIDALIMRKEVGDE
jgi:tRNA threonylcarbamoyl adenosine modification protein YeaZ/ribosomal-protein-alanine acetyltransferase